ncbi:MAG: hypothetical protein PHD67_03660 [Oscillospiraceae bacterium]|nr:hypothetical protein [Oscillospiraceae bacterium]
MKPFAMFPALDRERLILLAVLALLLSSRADPKVMLAVAYLLL